MTKRPNIETLAEVADRLMAVRSSLNPNQHEFMWNELTLLAQDVRRLSGTEPQTSWQPIATAPKDGTCVLITDFDGVEVVAFWQNGQWLVRWDHEHYESPTHWHALPFPLSRPQSK